VTMTPEAPAAQVASEPPSPPPSTRDPGSPARRGRRPADRTPDDLLTLGASLAAAVSLCWLIFSRFTDGIGWFGFLVAAFASFIAIYYTVTAEQHGPLVARDRVATAVVMTGSAVLLVPLAWLVGYVVVRGAHGLRLSFFFHDQRGITPTQPATAGGGSHAIVGTLEQVGLALGFSLPLGLLCAVFLNESRSRWRRPVRIFVDAMSGLPSIVAGLFIFAVLIIPYAKHTSLFGYNGLMAALALSMIMLPTITQTITVVLRLVPDGLREAALAMGSSRARMVWSIVLPTARTGITTAVVLGIARIVGETAPLLFTAFGYDLMNANPTSGSQESLPLFVYRNVLKPNKNSVDRAFAAALVLMLMVLGLFLLARYIGRDKSSNKSGSGRRGALVSRLSSVRPTAKAS
jgi:phosphate transport system permease protein